MTDDKVNPSFECSLSFLLTDERQYELMRGKAKARLETEKLLLFTDKGDSLVYRLREIVSLEEKDYHLVIRFVFDELLDLFFIGFKFEDFYRELSKAYNELILQDMLIKEHVRQEDVGADFAIFTPGGDKSREGKCHVRVFETSLVIIPEKGEILRFHLGNVKEIQPGDYNVSVVMDTGEKAVLSRMGYRLDPFKKVLEDILNELSSRARSLLQELMPGIDSSVLRRASSLLKEGNIALKKDIAAISPALWSEMEERILQSSLGDEYDFLKSLGPAEKLAVGFKRGLTGGAKSDYFWFAIPVFGGKPGEPGNAVVLEAGVIRTPDTEAAGPDLKDTAPGDINAPAEEELLKQEGKATYFFRVVGREMFAALHDLTRLERLESVYDGFIVSLNRCLQEVNFRREPIYLPENRLTEERYIKYRYAIKRLPELRRLRDLFIGRVMHKTPEQWRNDVLSLLKFNTLSRDDAAKWANGEKGG